MRNSTDANSRMEVQNFSPDQIERKRERKESTDTRDREQIRISGHPKRKRNLSGKTSMGDFSLTRAMRKANILK